ncbi:MAG: RNA polymerase sigma factor, partial [Saprospiraceae bacterium]
MTEQDIINGCKNNDRQCQRAFVDQYSAYLMGVCRRYITDGTRVQDCLQESLMKVLTSLNQYTEKGSFKSWAARITVNICLQTIRKEKRHINFDLDQQVDIVTQEVVNLKLEVDDVLRFLDTIPEKYRIAINMYIIEGYSHKEIGQHLGVTESSSRSLVTRGRKMIKSAFAEKMIKIVYKN